MKIQFYGQDCFSIENKDNSFVFNPNEAFQNQSTDVALLSLSSDTTVTIPNAKKTLALPGEFEISGILIRGVYADDRKNVLYKVIFEDIACIHLGNIIEKPSKETLKKLGENVSVLFVSVTSEFDAKMVRQVIEDIDPRVAFVGGDTSFFPKMLEQGAKIEESSSMTITKSSFNDDKTDVFILGV